MALLWLGGWPITCQLCLLARVSLWVTTLCG
jgi:hypothetical protein